MLAACPAKPANLTKPARLTDLADLTKPANLTKPARLTDLAGLPLVP